MAGLVGAVEMLGLTAALLPAGVLADRVDRRFLLRAASGGGALLYASLALAAVLDAVTLPHLLVVALLSGAAAGVFAPTEMSAVRTVVPRDQLPTALSQNQARQHVAGLVGGPLGGAMYGVARWLPFAADAVTYAVSWVLLGRLRTDLSAPTPGPRGAPLADLRDGIGFVARHPLFRTLTVLGLPHQPDRSTPSSPWPSCGWSRVASTRCRSAWSRPPPRPRASSARCSRPG